MWFSPPLKLLPRLIRFFHHHRYIETRCVLLHQNHHKNDDFCSSSTTEIKIYEAFFCAAPPDDENDDAVFEARVVARQQKTRWQNTCCFCCAHNIQTTQNTQLSSQRKKEKTKEGKKNVFRVSNFFLKRKRQTERREHTSFISRERALYYSCSFSVEQKKRTRNVGWNAVRAPSHAEGTKNAFSLFVSRLCPL